MRRRILTATLAVTVVTLLVFGVPLAWALGRLYRGQELTRLQQAAITAAAAVPIEGLHGPDPIEPPTVPPGVNLAYYDDQGHLVAGSGPAQAGVVARRALTGNPDQSASGPRVVSAQPIVANETTLGVVEASSSAAALAGRIERAWSEMLALGLVALGAAALIALRQARRLARPVEGLIGAAGRLGESDFTLQADLSGIAEVDRASQALAATSQRLRELLARERGFTANASHQLRTPLTALRLSLDNALMTPGVDVQQALRDAVNEVDRLEATLDQLFTLARNGSAAAGAGPLVTRSVPVGDILDALERRWHPLLAQRGRRLRVSQDEQVAARRAPATLGQILDILVDNATTHGEGTVAVEAHAVGGGMSIGVHDEGHGVRPGDEGLGLGLARTLTEAAGGRLVLRQPAAPEPAEQSTPASAAEPGPVAAVVLP